MKKIIFIIVLSAFSSVVEAHRLSTASGEGRSRKNQMISWATKNMSSWDKIFKFSVIDFRIYTEDEVSWMIIRKYGIVYTITQSHKEHKIIAHPKKCGCKYCK